MPYGRDFGVGGVSSLISPVFGSSRPTRLAFCSVNHKMPVWSKISVWGSLASGSGILYSVTAPVFGSSLPTRAPVLPVYQMLPSLPSTRPCGPECGVLRGYSLKRPSLRIEPAEHVVHLTCVPERPVPRGQRIVRSRSGCGHLPLLDRDLGGARDHHPHGLVLLREILGQVLGDDGGLIGRHGHAMVGQ